MDGFTGFKTAAAEELPEAHAVMEPSPWRPAGRRRPGPRQASASNRRPQDTAATPGTPCTECDAPCTPAWTSSTCKQRTRLEAVFTEDHHAQVEARWNVYQKIVGAYRNPDRTAGRTQLAHLIDAIHTGVPTLLTEITTLGRTLKRRACDVLAYWTEGCFSDRSER